MTATLRIYKIHKGATLPQYATELSACFDLAYFPGDEKTIKGYDVFNGEKNVPTDGDGSFCILPRERLLIPTSLILDIEPGYSVRVHTRSGIGLKKGMLLCQAEGVVDADYVQQLYLPMVNLTEDTILIKPNDRLCQAEVVKLETISIEERLTPPERKSSRDGGFGSTGVTKLPQSLTSLLNSTAKELVSTK